MPELTINLSKEELDALQQAADRLGCTLQQAAEQLISDHYSELTQHLRQLPTQGNC